MLKPHAPERFEVSAAIAFDSDGDDLLDRLAYLEGEPLRSALCHLSDLKDRRSVPALLGLLRTGDPNGARSVAHTIAVLGGRQACIGLQQVAEGACHEEVRLAAVYGLTWLFDDRALAPLLRLFRNPAEPPPIRAQAAEGLSYLLSHPVTREVWQEAMGALLSGLEDAEVDVRFWSAHALGAMKARPALSRLRDLAANDPGHNRQMDWSVREEAAAAVERIEGPP